MCKVARLSFSFFITSFLLSSLALAAQVKITTTSLPAGTVNTQYSATITTTGGSSPFVWSVSAGSLPPGLSLTPSSNTRSATLAGTPTAAATYTFSISVTGHGGHTSTVAYTLTIQTPPVEHVVDLTWTENGGNVIGYNVFRATTHGGPYTQINASLVAATMYADNTVLDGTTYYYVTTAVDPAGEQSAYSNEAEAQVPGN